MSMDFCFKFILALSVLCVGNVNADQLLSTDLVKKRGDWERDLAAERESWKGLPDLNHSEEMELEKVLAVSILDGTKRITILSEGHDKEDKCYVYQGPLTESVMDERIFGKFQEARKQESRRLTSYLKQILAPVCLLNSAEDLKRPCRHPAKKDLLEVSCQSFSTAERAAYLDRFNHANCKYTEKDQSGKDEVKYLVKVPYQDDLSRGAIDPGSDARLVALRKYVDKQIEEFPRGSPPVPLEATTCQSRTEMLEFKRRTVTSPESRQPGDGLR